MFPFNHKDAENCVASILISAHAWCQKLHIWTNLSCTVIAIRYRLLLNLQCTIPSLTSRFIVSNFESIFYSNEPKGLTIFNHFTFFRAYRLSNQKPKIAILGVWLDSTCMRARKNVNWFKMVTLLGFLLQVLFFYISMLVFVYAFI